MCLLCSDKDEDDRWARARLSFLLGSRWECSLTLLIPRLKLQESLAQVPLPMSQKKKTDWDMTAQEADSTYE